MRVGRGLRAGLPVGLLLACSTGPAPEPPPLEAPPLEAPPLEDGVAGVAYYTCPMHPSVRQPGPGSCPLCGMDLTPVTVAEQSSGAVQVDAHRRDLFGIELEAAAVRPMGAALELPAVVGWDTDALFDLSARVSGWVGEVRAAPGEQVRAGQVLCTYFSPDLVSAQEDLVRASADAAKGDSAALARRDAARLRLARLGLGDADLDALVAHGHVLEQVPLRAPRAGVVVERSIVAGGMVSPGQALYRLGDPSTMWVEAAVPEEQIPWLRPGQPVSVVATGLDGPVAGTLDQVLPALDPATRTARVHAHLRNVTGRLRPDQWATLRVDLGTADRLAVPATAVLYTGPRRVVFVEEGEDRFVPREVVTGVRSDGYIEIVAGLTPGDRVVRAGNFLVAADSRLRSGGEGVAPAPAP